MSLITVLSFTIKVIVLIIRPFSVCSLWDDPILTDTSPFTIGTLHLGTRFVVPISLTLFP